MTRTAIDRTDLRDVFLATQDMPVVTIGTVSEEFDGRVNKSYARLILATLTDMGLLYEAAADAPGSHEGYHWDQGDSQAFDDAWEARFNDPEARVAGDTKEKNMTEPATSKPITCGCGCHQNVAKGRIYRPGHDARHASAVAREVASMTVPAERARYIENHLPTQALRIKAQGQASRLIDRASAKASKPTRTANPNASWEAGEAKVGRWIYPARRKPNGRTAQVNTQRDGKGTWKSLDPAKFQDLGTN